MPVRLFREHPRASDGRLGTRQEASAMEAKLTEAEKDQIRKDQEEKDARILANILEAHPELTKDEALEMLQEAGF
jgi:hypothetical protein